MGVHADGVLRADFDAKSAINAFAKVQNELGGVFFDIGIRVLRGGDLDASGRAYGLTHHAGHTSGRTVLASG